MHGYEMIQQIAERSQDLWRPSPGSVYPTLQLLVDEMDRGEGLPRSEINRLNQSFHRTIVALTGSERKYGCANLASNATAGSSTLVVTLEPCAMCAGAIVVITATCGQTCVARLAISPAWFMPISKTPNLARSGRRARLSGTPT